MSLASSPTSVIRVNFDYIGLKPFSIYCLSSQPIKNESGDYIEFSGGHPSNYQFNRRYYCSRYPFLAPNGEFVVSGPGGKCSELVGVSTVTSIQDFRLFIRRLAIKTTPGSCFVMSSRILATIKGKQ